MVRTAHARSTLVKTSYPITVSNTLYVPSWLRSTRSPTFAAYLATFFRMVADLGLLIFFSLGFLFFYIDIIQGILEIASKILGFLRQGILTLLFMIFMVFGTRFARANIIPNRMAQHLLILIRRKSLCSKGLHQTRAAALDLSRYRARVYVQSFTVTHMYSSPTYMNMNTRIGILSSPYCGGSYRFRSDDTL